LRGKAFCVASAATAGASFSSAQMIVTARFIVVRSGTSECGFSSVGAARADTEIQIRRQN
jgi:hypothetical protein